MARSEEKLHRLKDNKNDWDDKPHDQLNAIERVSKATKGVLSPGSMVTHAGLGAFIKSMVDYVNGHKVMAFVELGLSRGADLGDGALADATNTKSKFGRDYDPTVDAAELMVGAPILTYVGALPLSATVIMVAPKVIESAASINARRRGIEVNPTDEGKLGAGAMWGGIISLLAKFAFERNLPGYVDTALDVVGWGGVVGGTVYKLPATREYLQAGFGPMPENLAVLPTVPPEIEK